ncbi:MAG: MMPL family transporter [Candidatus Latescibacterota bacterium]|nr:MMPL family transporter [Candidatus Latescibacterota bacterium]
MRIDYQRLVHYIYHHYIGIIALALVLSVFSGFFAVKLAKNLKTDFADLLPNDYDSVRELNRIKARIGGIGPLMVVITSDDMDRAVDFMLVLADSLGNSPLITSLSRLDNKRELIEANRFLYMDLEDLQEIHARLDDHIELQKLKQSPLYFALDDEEEEGLDFSDIEAKYRKKNGDLSAVEEQYGQYVLTKEGNGVILRLYPAGVITDVEFSRDLLASLDQTITAIDPKRFHPSIEYVYKGSFKNSPTQVNIITQDLKSTASYSIIGVLLLITFYFRQILGSLFITLPLMMSLTWTFGVTYLVIGSLNMITVGLFAILFGLGIDFGIHIFARYREARRRGLNIEQALTETVVHTGSALTTTAITTAVAFYSLLLTDFKGFSEFGFIIGTGILFSLVAMVAICPAFIILAERLRLIRLLRKEIPRHLLRKGHYPMPKTTLFLGAVATFYSLFHLGALEFEYDFSKLKPKPPISDNKGSLPQSLKEGRSPAIVLTESYQEAMEVVQTVRNIKAAKGDSSTILNVKSVYSVLPQDQDAKLSIIAKIRTLLDREEGLFSDEERAEVDSLRPYLDVGKLTLYDLPTDLTNEFKSKDGEILSFVAINASVQLKDGQNAIRFAEEISQIETPSGKTYLASSSHVIIAEMLVVMLDDSALAVILTLAVVTLVLLVDLRSFVDTFLVLTPLLAALAWVTGFMYVFDIKLNLYNMVAFPTIIGMGIDNGVHIFHRYRETGNGSLRLVLRTTGMALLATSLTTMVGFSGLVPAIHPALTSIGVLSLMGLGSCFIASVTLLPALLQIREQYAA